MIAAMHDVHVPRAATRPVPEGWRARGRRIAGWLAAGGDGLGMIRE